MSAQVACAVLHLKGLSPEERLSLVLLGDNADGFDVCEFPVKHFAGRVGLPSAAIVRTVRSFAQTGILTVEKAERRGWMRVQFHIGRDGEFPPLDTTKSRPARHG